MSMYVLIPSSFLGNSSICGKWVSVIVNEIHKLGLGPSLGRVIFRSSDLCPDKFKQCTKAGICIWLVFVSNWTVVVKLNCDVGFDLVTW